MTAASAATIEFSPAVDLSFSLATFPASEEEQAWRRCATEIRRLRTLSDDWDLAGAIAPSAEAITNALAYLTRERSRQPDRPPNFISASPSGTVVLEWEWPDAFIELEIDASFLHRMYREPGGEIKHQHVWLRRPDEGASISEPSPGR